MKGFLLAVFVVVLAISLAVYALRYWQEASQQGQTPIVIQSVLTGVLEPVQSTGEYSDAIVSGSRTIGVTSGFVNLRPYENRKVKVIGEYVGGTMYADSVTILP